jgi:phosphoadenosine phosphosulfate reductase
MTRKSTYQSGTINEVRNQIDELNDRFEGHHADEVLTWAWNQFGSGVVLGTGFGASGVFLIERISRLGLGIPLFYLDTHLLFDQTYELHELIEKKLGVSIEAVPPSMTLEEQAEKHGDELWKRQPDQCCHIRKVIPLQNHLKDKQAWITGMRRGQSESRQGIRVIEYDSGHHLIKINPVAAYSKEEIWDEIHSRKIPYNPLHDEGYPSIGCIPCTSPVAEGEDERKGRWRGADKVECGIHINPDTGKVERGGGS